MPVKPAARSGLPSPGATPFSTCLPEHDPEKWKPVFRKDHAPAKNLDHDPIHPDRIMV
jgi:hypothetical protein